MRIYERQQTLLLCQIFNVLLLSGTHFLAVRSQTLSSNLTAEPLCPGEIVIFTCETRGSTILAWTSDEYIESGGTRLELATFNNVRDTRISPVNQNTVATLISKSDENGVDVLVSTLRIRALSEFLDSSVTCVHVDGGGMNTTRVSVLADAAAPRIRDSALRFGNDANETCVAQLSWESPININVMDIKYYEVHFYAQLIANEIDDENKGFVSAVYEYENCNCTDLNEFRVRAVNRCNRPGGNNITTLNPPTLLRTLDCNAPDLTTETPTDPAIAERDLFSDSSAIGITVALVIVGVYSIIISLILVIICIIRNDWGVNNKPTQGKQDETELRGNERKFK